MKNRRLVIGAFLLVATLIAGIAYADVSGQLNIGGGAEFYGYNKTAETISDAIKFSMAAEDTTTSEHYVIDAAVTSEKQATFDIRFDDIEESDTDSFTAFVKYTIIYDTSDMELHDVTLSENMITFNQGAAGVFPDGWNVDVAFGETVLSPGEETTVTIEVTYQNQTGDENRADNYPITITLNYEVVHTNPS